MPYDTTPTPEYQEIFRQVVRELEGIDVECTPAELISRIKDGRLPRGLIEERMRQDRPAER